MLKLKLNVAHLKHSSSLYVKIKVTDILNIYLVFMLRLNTNRRWSLVVSYCPHPIKPLITIIPAIQRLQGLWLKFIILLFGTDEWTRANNVPLAIEGTQNWPQRNIVEFSIESALQCYVLFKSDTDIIFT